LEDKLISKEIIDDISDKILNYSKDGTYIKNVKLVGSTGEPLMNPLTGYIINKFYGKRDIRFFTNGINLGLNYADKNYIRELAKANSMHLSLDAGTTKLLHDIKPGAKKSGVSIEDILKSINIMKKYNPHLWTMIGYVVSEKNYSDIIEATKKAKRFGGNIIRFRVDMSGFNVSDSERKKTLESLNKAKCLEDSNFKVNFIHSQEEFLGKKNCFGTLGKCNRCYACEIWACVGPNGDMYPCGHIVDKNTESYGSLIENDFKDIWEGERRKKINETLPNRQCSICAPSAKRSNDVVDFFTKIKRKYCEKLIKNA
jgi:radical SAM protein with 4Fe4S-binding SPASM domain